MHSANQTHRQCVDCYYRVNRKCKIADIAAQRHNMESNDNCEFFIRASLRFAFFPKM